MSMGASAQGIETFDQSTLGATYSDGSFVGDNGITWTYVHSRNEGDFVIEGKGHMLRRADNPSSITGTFECGIGSFSIDTRKAFIGNIQRKLELIINGVRVAEFLPAFPDGGSDVVLNWSVENINVAGTVELTIRSFGDTGNQQVVLDNLAWTGYEEAAPEFTTNWSQAKATENLPAWFTTSNEMRSIAYGVVGDNEVVLVLRNNGVIKVLNASTGVEIRDLDVTGYTGTGTFLYSDVAISDDGKIFVGNMTGNHFHPFRLNMWSAIDGTREEVLTFANPQNAAFSNETYELGRTFTLVGSYTEGTAVAYVLNTKVANSVGNKGVVLRFAQTGANLPFESTPTVINLSDDRVSTNGTVIPTGLGSSDFYYGGNGNTLRKYSASGTDLGAADVTVIPSLTNKVAFVGNVNGDDYLVMHVYGTANQNAFIVKVPEGVVTLAEKLDSTPTLGDNANGNGTGSVDFKVNTDGTLTVFALGTNNGFGSYTWTGPIFTPPAATPDYAYVQLIHNSADPAVALVDVYVNSTEVPSFTDVAFRTASEFLEFEAGVPHSIILTPAGQPATSGLEFDNLVFMADENYYAVVGGVIDPSQFAVNPSAVSTALIIDIISGALLVNPEGTQEVAFVTYHGSTDAPGVDIAIRDVGVIAVNAMYTDVVDYVSAPADAYIIDIAPTGGDVLFSYSADFSTLGGQTAMVIASGFLTPSANKDGEDFALIAVLVDGTVVNLPLTSTDIESGIGLPDDFRLSQNYPNPFNPTTRIEFDMPVSGDVTLAVYDLLGRQVALLANENYAAGTHNIAFDASQLASGVYMYRLNVAGQTFTRKMTLVK